MRANLATGERDVVVLVGRGLDTFSPSGVDRTPVYPHLCRAGLDRGGSGSVPQGLDPCEVAPYGH
jgi:hypothetical protein